MGFSTSPVELFMLWNYFMFLIVALDILCCLLYFPTEKPVVEMYPDFVIVLEPFKLYLFGGAGLK
jgi:hypothetical protein